MYVMYTSTIYVLYLNICMIAQLFVCIESNKFESFQAEDLDFLSILCGCGSKETVVSETAYCVDVDYKIE